ncbi:MAG: hypothetical protein RBT65_12785 [Methanolobus sp.]|nr:hypothetical protein [Methanolobus sp.]
MDHILKEELWRSIPVCFFSFLILALINESGYLAIDAILMFILAIIVTIAHVLLMVWYRKKEGLESSSIFFILDHIGNPKFNDEENTKNGLNNKKNHLNIIFIILIYVAYIIASLMYNVNQILWILVLILMGGTFANIFLFGNDIHQKYYQKWSTFYLITSFFIFLRYLILSYSIIPLIKGFLLVAIVSLVFLKVYLHFKNY